MLRVIANFFNEDKWSDSNHNDKTKECNKDDELINYVTHDHLQQPCKVSNFRNTNKKQEKKK